MLTTEVVHFVLLCWSVLTASRHGSNPPEIPLEIDGSSSGGSWGHGLHCGNKEGTFTSFQQLEVLLVCGAGAVLHMQHCRCRINLFERVGRGKNSSHGAGNNSIPIFPAWLELLCVHTGHTKGWRAGELVILSVGCKK